MAYAILTFHLTLYFLSFAYYKIQLQECEIGFWRWIFLNCEFQLVHCIIIVFIRVLNFQ